MLTQKSLSRDPRSEFLQVFKSHRVVVCCPVHCQILFCPESFVEKTKLRGELALWLLISQITGNRLMVSLLGTSIHSEEVCVFLRNKRRIR